MRSLRRPFVSPACNALTRPAMAMVQKGDSMASPRSGYRLQASHSCLKSSETSSFDAYSLVMNQHSETSKDASSMRFVNPRKDSSFSSAAVPKGVSFLSEEVTTSDDSLDENCRPDLSTRFSASPRKDSSSSSAAVPRGVSFVSEEVSTSDDSLDDNCRPDLSTRFSASPRKDSSSSSATVPKGVSFVSEEVTTSDDRFDDNCRPDLSIRTLICYTCGEEGHIAKLCPRMLAVETQVSEKTCPCGAGVCRVLTARTLKNSGRQFYKCPLLQEDGGCNFFQWCDVESYQHLSKENAPTIKPPVPICRCGAGACSLRTAKTENNKGREFYICPRGQAGCGFFAWRDVVIPVLNATPAHCFNGKTDDHWAERGSYVSETLNPNIFAGAGAQTCFNCGKEGHWAKDCPTREFFHIGQGRSGGSDSYKGETGGMFSGIYRGSPKSRRDIGVVMERSNRCFKCGMAGHWSKLCPNV